MTPNRTPDPASSIDTPLVAVIGGGQLGRMLALAGIPLGLQFRFLEQSPSPPGSAVGEVISAPYDAPDAIAALIEGAAAVTYEFENVPVEAVLALPDSVPVFPPPAALRMAQDRLDEKKEFHRFGVETAPFRPVSSMAELETAVADVGLPAVLKTRRFGYDGKGQVVLRSEADLAPAWEELGSHPLILEGFVDFRRELSVIGVRGRDGSIAVYPLTENDHWEGILRRSRAPAPECGEALISEARGIVTRILEGLDYVGVLAVELFDTERGLIANELAPRVHNSGHWTQDGAVTSQFESHLRAILGLPLGSVDAVGFTTMVNLIGALPPRAALAAIPGCHIHFYGKSPRPGRKVGHVNITGPDEASVRERADRVEKLLAE